MNYISVENLTKTYGIVTLFEDISFNINEGDKIAIVAKNGSGKTTLLNILMGKDFADSGTVVINKDIQVVLFDQEIHFESGQTITEFIMSLDSPPVQALKNYQKSLTSDDTEFIERAFIEMENQKAWGLENEMKQILSQLKITDLNAKMDNLSGGQIKRVALAKLLIETRVEHKHTLLIMDEPTNHLDIDSKEVLEDALIAFDGTLLFVSHDRYFINRLATQVVEITPQGVKTYLGDYDYYQEVKAEEALIAQSQASEASRCL